MVGIDCPKSSRLQQAPDTDSALQVIQHTDHFSNLFPSNILRPSLLGVVAFGKVSERKDYSLLQMRAFYGITCFICLRWVFHGGGRMEKWENGNKLIEEKTHLLTTGSISLKLHYGVPAEIYARL